MKKQKYEVGLTHLVFINRAGWFGRHGWRSKFKSTKWTQRENQALYIQWVQSSWWSAGSRNLDKAKRQRSRKSIHEKRQNLNNNKRKKKHLTVNKIFFFSFFFLCERNALKAHRKQNLSHCTKGTLSLSNFNFLLSVNSTLVDLLALNLWQ